MWYGSHQKTTLEWLDKEGVSETITFELNDERH